MRPSHAQGAARTLLRSSISRFSSVFIAYRDSGSPCTCTRSTRPTSPLPSCFTRLKWLSFSAPSFFCSAASFILRASHVSRVSLSRAGMYSRVPSAAAQSLLASHQPSSIS